MRKLILIAALIAIVIGCAVQVSAQTTYSSQSATFENPILNTSHTIKTTNASYGTFKVDNYEASNYTASNVNTVISNYDFNEPFNYDSNQNKVRTSYKVFTSDKPDKFDRIVNKNESVKFRISNDDSHVRMITYEPDGTVSTDRIYLIDAIDFSDPRWSVYSVHNDNMKFDIIFFSQSDGEKLIIFDYLNGSHTEITGDLDY